MSLPVPGTNGVHVDALPSLAMEAMGEAAGSGLGQVASSGVWDRWQVLACGTGGKFWSMVSCSGQWCQAVVSGVMFWSVVSGCGQCYKLVVSAISLWSVL